MCAAAAVWCSAIRRVAWLPSPSSQPPAPYLFHRTSLSLSLSLYLSLSFSLSHSLSRSHTDLSLSASVRVCHHAHTLSVCLSVCVSVCLSGAKPQTWNNIAGILIGLAGALYYAWLKTPGYGAPAPAPPVAGVHSALSRARLLALSPACLPACMPACLAASLVPCMSVYGSVSVFASVCVSVSACTSLTLPPSPPLLPLSLSLSPVLQQELLGPTARKLPNRAAGTRRRHC